MKISPVAKSLPFTSLIIGLGFGGLLALSQTALGVDWIPVGPAPTINGQDEGITTPEGMNPVAGVIESLAPSGTDANVLYVASGNGGVWKTTNAKDASPVWTPLTDRALPSLSLSSIAISPLDPNVIFVGSGRVSSLASSGGKQFGVARSTDAGVTWTVVGAALADQNVRSILPTRSMDNGNPVVLAGSSNGIYRSADNGTTFTQVSNGIPPAVITDLVADPAQPTNFYAATGGKIYRSIDTGASWQEVSTGTGFTVVPDSRILLSVHNSPANNVVYAAIIGGGRLANVYRSADQGATWTALNVPMPVIFPGAQGGSQGAILADRMDPNTVWLSGDRQPDQREISGNPMADQFPNANGANNYTGYIARNVSGAWQLMTHNGANGTAPHADSRTMAFDADGNILHGCDGGIFKLDQPNLPARRWLSLNGNISPTEAHSGAYDPVARLIFMSGNQDNGVSVQQNRSSFVWNQATQGDGGKVAIDADQTAHPGQSIRYFSSQNFGGFSRQTFDNNGAAVGAGETVGLMITAGTGAGQTLRAFDMGIQFYQPFVLNQLSPNRMLIGTTNLYESMDKGDTLTNLGSVGTAPVGDDTNTGSSAMSYGSRLDGTPFPDAFYVGAANTTYPPRHSWRGFDHADLSGSHRPGRFNGSV